jgi:hypothetical protein
MNVKDLQIGDVFRIVHHRSLHIKPDQLWCKVTNNLAQAVEAPSQRRFELDFLANATIELVERTDGAPIRRAGSTLVLKGGDVLLQFIEAWDVMRCTPGEKFIEFVLRGSAFHNSKATRVGPSTALAIKINTGAAALGRPISSTIFAYQGRVYARATAFEVTGKKTTAGYKRAITIDGSRRLVIAGLLGIPNEGALHDIMQDHFGQG